MTRTPGNRARFNRIMKKVCGAMTSLQGVFEFFEGAIEKQEDRALLRTARLALPAVSMAGVDDVRVVRGQVHGADPFRNWDVAVSVHDHGDGGRRDILWWWWCSA